MRLVETMAEIANCRALDVQHRALGRVLDSASDAASALKLLAEDEHVALDPSLAECYFGYRDVALHWRGRNSESSASGEFHLTNLAEAIITGPARLGATNASTGLRDVLEQLRPIDDQPRSGTGTLAALRVEPGATQPEVWFHHGTRGTVRLDVGYCEYLETLLITKGFHQWQYLFADVSLRARDWTNVAKQLRGMLEFLPRHFPEHHYEPLAARLKERGGAR